MELHPDEFSFLLEESKDKLSAVLPKEENGEIFENLQLKIIRALDLKTNAERKARAQEGEVVGVMFTENLVDIVKKHFESYKAMINRRGKCKQMCAYIIQLFVNARKRRIHINAMKAQIASNCTN